ncbi:MAG: signal peptidase I [Sphingomonadales bacterium]|nr:signal peptidase I [Sphingomonadales bacterium]
MTDATSKPAADDAAKPVEEPAEKKDSLGELIRTIIYAVLIALGIRTVAFEPFNIPSESMLPALMVGDYLFISKYSYGYSRHSLPASLPLFSGRILEKTVKRGDIAVFKLPSDGRTDYIKRIIGLPGDRLQMKSGQLFINGQPVPRERVEDFVFRETPNSECGGRFIRYRTVDADGVAYCNYPQYRETLPNGVSYMTLDLSPRGDFDNTRVYVVPEGHYFAMGDNRDNSQDSRLDAGVRGVGYVPAENLVGRAEVIFFSTDGKARLWQPWYWIQAARFDRFFNSLRP